VARGEIRFEREGGIAMKEGWGKWEHDPRNNSQIDFQVHTMPYSRPLLV